MKHLSNISKYFTRKNLSSSILELEGLRFFSIMLVVLQHFSERIMRYGDYRFEESSIEHQFSFFLSRGTIGVYIFFAISGYVLTLPWIKQEYSIKQNYKSFLIRRFSRIEPPYLIWMSIFLVVLIFNTNLGVVEVLKHYLSSILYSHNLVYQSHSIINPVAWSLEVELQFYLLAPFLVKALWSIKNIKHRILFILSFIFLFQTLQFQFGWWHFPQKITLLGALPHFLVGILMVNIISLKAIKTKKSYVYDVLFILSWITLSYIWSTEYIKNIAFTLILSLLFFSAFNSILINKFLTFKWVIIIGGMCYSIYLIHLPLIEFIFQKIFIHFQFNTYYTYFFIGLGISLVLILLISILSFLFVEKPFMKYNESIVFDLIKKTKAIRINTISKKVIFPILILLILSGSTNAQDIDATKFQLLPIENLIDSALSNNAKFQIQASKKEIIRQQIKLTNKNWLNHVSITGNSLYGTGSIIDNQYTASTEIVRFQNSTSVNYNIGLSMRIPLSSLLNTGNEKKILKEQYKIVEQEDNDLLIELIQKISTVYYSIVNNMNQLELASETMEANRMKMELSETYFKSGKIDIGIYKTDLENYYQSKAKYLELLNNCNKEIYLLKKLVGTEIAK
jgi:peptidoglycan/LPS O-acetylase OafA/YrhL